MDVLPESCLRSFDALPEAGLISDDPLPEAGLSSKEANLLSMAALQEAGLICDPMALLGKRVLPRSAMLSVSVGNPSLQCRRSQDLFGLPVVLTLDACPR